MTTLAAELLRHRAAPIDAVENAMLRQSLYGGDLATNLLELAAISEADLLGQLSLTFELEMAAPGQLPVASDALKRVMPAETASRHGIFPIALDGEDIIVAVSVPLMTSTIEDLAFSLGYEVKQRIALEVRIRQALSRDYRLPLPDRFVRLSVSLDSGQPLNLSIPPPRASSRSFSSGREPTGKPIDAASVNIPTLVSSRAHLVPHLPLPSVTPSKGEKPARRFGPFTSAMLEKELKNANSARDVLRIWLDYAAQFFEFTAMFTIQGDIACGLESRGANVPSESLSHLGMPLEFPSVLSDARRSGRWTLTTLSSEGIDVTIARDLKRVAGRKVLVIPIMLRGRAVAILYGDHGDVDVELGQVGEIIAIVPLVERAMGRVLVSRKRIQGEPGDFRSMPPRSIPPVSDAPAAVSVPPTSPAAFSSIAAPAAPSHLPAATPRMTPPLGLLQASAVDVVDSRVPTTLSAESAAVTRMQPESFARRIVNIESSPNPAPAPPKPEPPAQNPPRTFSVPRIPVTETHAPRPEEDITTPPTQLSAPPPDMTLPRIDTDYEQKSLEVIKRILAGDETAIAELLAFGDAGASVLVRELPGPVVIPTRAVRPDLGPIRASECGPLLKAMAAYGPTARPYVIARTADADPRVRQWTTRLLGELPGRQSAMAVAQRLMHDRDAEVRRAAFAAGQLLANDSESALALRGSLSGAARNETLAVTQRLAALDALSDLRDGQATPTLWRLLQDHNPSIAAAAEQALAVLAGRDFGHDIQAWEHWWERNKARSRVEWLIDALIDDSPNVRQSAMEQLRQISRIYVGYFDDNLLEERVRVQERYRTWWQSSGQGASNAPSAT